MLLEHIFENIDDAWDYILCEELEEREKDHTRLKAPFVGSFERGEIVPNSIDYPLNAYYNNADPNKYIIQRVASGRFALKPNLRHRKLLFRGQNTYFENCSPSLFRKKTDNYITQNVKAEELKLLTLTHPLVQLLDIGVELNSRVFQFEMNLYGLAQHYYCQTPFIDLSSDPNVASFFAVTEYNSETDTYKPISDETKLGVIYFYNINTQTDFQPNLAKGHSDISTIVLQVFPRSGKQKGFLFQANKYENFNDHPQVTAVRFKHNANMSNRIFAEHNQGLSLFPSDILEQHWKNYNMKMKIISENTLKLNASSNKDKSIDILHKELTDEGFTINNYQPIFSAEELNDYYNEIKNGYWEEFCSDIFFPGDTYGRYKEALLNVEKDERYQWAFRANISHTIDYNKGFLLSQLQQFLK